MPLNTQIVRNGEPIRLPNGWGGFHMAAMVYASAFEATDGPNAHMAPNEELNYPDEPQAITPGNVMAAADYGAIASTPLNGGSYTLKERHKFIDITDGEVLELLPGDELRAWRSMK